ncbi:radical SAM protein [Desulfobacter vibrioformis]|uniref:radical SAM protein n=1 Tax=Desulfobacter vibrioformis TaxID=34031 RepID=UPI000554E149|nr:radical SAM protein [Desulfobacter vibrioformis]
MHYEGMVIRPPSEADSILLQVTLGCSHNKCTFCGTYRGKRFNIKKDDVIFEDIEFASKYCRRQNRLFLCDGDALVIPMRRLVPILERIRERLPWVERVGVYANTKSIKMKTDEELALLHKLGIKIAYMGLESGDNKVLGAICKGADADTMVTMGKKLKKAGIKVSVTVLLGLGGRKGSLDHARETGRVLTAMDPDFVGALSLMLIPGTELHDQYVNGDFQLPGPEEMLTELGAMIAATNLTDGLFHANHASNYLPVRAHLPRDKEKTLELISQALDGKIPLKPEHMRAL